MVKTTIMVRKHLINCQGRFSNPIPINKRFLKKNTTHLSAIITLGEINVQLLLFKKTFCLRINISIYNTY